MNEIDFLFIIFASYQFASLPNDETGGEGRSLGEVTNGVVTSGLPGG